MRVRKSDIGIERKRENELERERERERERGQPDESCNEDKTFETLVFLSGRSDYQALKQLCRRKISR